MFKKIYYAIAGDPNDKAIKRYEPIVEEINALEPEFERKSSDELRAMTAAFRSRIEEETAELREDLHAAEREYLDVLGTDEQKYARVEVDRTRKAL
ncbi:MAG: hypothetical protein KDD83_13495, partial [Caldilineaceae bacterium]|nr:hypothetical protein [Caldilineaceae bacterium]